MLLHQDGKIAYFKIQPRRVLHVCVCVCMPAYVCVFSLPVCGEGLHIHGLPGLSCCHRGWWEDHPHWLSAETGSRVRSSLTHPQSPIRGAETSHHPQTHEHTHTQQGSIELKHTDLGPCFAGTWMSGPELFSSQYFPLTPCGSLDSL